MQEYRSFSVPQRHANTARSAYHLVVIDSSIINYLATKRLTPGRPRVVMTTHFLVRYFIFFVVLCCLHCLHCSYDHLTTREQEIFRNDLLEPELIVNPSLRQNEGEQREGSPTTARVVCTVMASTDAPESYSATSSAAPLYELRHGISSHSNALTCAAKCGIPLTMVQRAQEVLECTKRGVPISSRRQSAGPSPAEQLHAFFSSIDDWQATEDDALSKFLTIARMGNQ
ncbi:hypothetical protein AM587_10012596 [Phytophthora nicotianae]|uniref:Uncharacterized protein n=1 Tax=Phytophthora nicotianae TaxID=4792 RepID=A0A0W8C0E0_PHYNI|nr:hypothetical protein AM587_10012596 [Phytophthora nicotianae]